MDRPLVLLDVDGVLNVLADEPGLVTHRAAAHDGSVWTLRIRPKTPELVARLAASSEVVWCSTWLNAADVIAPLVGLPKGLDRVDFPWGGPPPHLGAGISRKAPYVRAWLDEHLDGRVAVWLDDDIGAADEAELATADGTVRCHRINPTLGLRVSDVEAVERWSAGP